VAAVRGTICFGHRRSSNGSTPGCIRRSCSALDPMSSNTTFCVYPGRPQAATLRRSGRKAQDLNA
jgi:hypothetical protein